MPKVAESNGRISLSTPAGDRFLTAAEIYQAVFQGGIEVEGVNLSERDVSQSGLAFSDSPCTPALLLEATGDSGGPVVSARVAGIVKKAHAVAQADYIILNRTWYPLPVGTVEEVGSALKTFGADFGDISIGQYLQILRSAFPFDVIDDAAPSLTAERIGSSLEVPKPDGLNASLFPYQETGFRWLSFMARNGVGSILADEMGLGKTLQVIAVLLAESNAGRRPNLVVCPATIIENWRREISKFAPKLSVHIHSGPRRTGRAKILGDCDVAVCSYDTMAADIFLLSEVPWNFVVIDEAQSIKNPQAQRTIKAKRVPHRVAVAITGTPVENSLRDLWSLTDFIAPGQLGTLDSFERRYPDTESSASRLEPLVSSVLLRRRVQEVARDLPERIDIPVALEMDATGAATYEEIRTEAANRMPGSPDFVAMVPLRMFCSHPWAAGKLKDRDPFECSPKLCRLFEILEEIVVNREKALVFTSFQETADILKQLIADRLGIFAECIDGRLPVPNRQPMVDKFSSLTRSAVLVLNPKAAGVGLNITAANHVIHYNLEWNPAVEDQASARSHRRGQTRPVTVHRLFYSNTLEEVIDDRMARKRTLASTAVVGTDGREVDIADLRRALTISPVQTR